MKSLGFLGENKVTMRLFSEDLSLRDIHSFSISFYLSIASSLTSSVSCTAQNAAQDWKGHQQHDPRTVEDWATAVSF